MAQQALIKIPADTPLLQQYPPLFGNRNFLLMWAGSVISALGDRIHMIVMLEILSRLMSQLYPGSGRTVGTQENAQLTVMMLAPFFFFGPVTGMLADRFPRRAIMITSDVVRVVIVIIARTLFLRETGTLTAPVLYGMLLASEFILATFAATFSPARMALLPQLVHPDQLLRANSLTSAAGTIASLLGFILAAALVTWNLSYAMFVDAGTFLGSAICLGFMRVPRTALTPLVSRGPKPSVLQELKDGAHYIRTHRRVFQIIILMLIFWACGAVILNGLMGIVTHYYGLSIAQYSNFLGVIGFGMILGAASVSLFKHGIPKELGIAWAMTGVGVFLFVFSLMQHWLPGVIFVTLAAACGAVLLVSLDTLLQRIVPNFVRGRVMGVRDVITTFGLLALTVPLALWPGVDHYIRYLLMGLSVFVTGVGLGLVKYYYSRQTLPPVAAIVLRFARGYLSMWHSFQRVTACRIPTNGAVLVVANHSSAIDPVILQSSSARRIIHFMMAREYYEMKPFYWIYKAFGAIPVNRTGTDIAALRRAVRLLKEGKVVGMFPEGRISLTGELQDARLGVAKIALMSGATIVPAHIHGTLPHQSMMKDFTKRTHLTVRYGAPLRFNQFAGKDRDPDTLEQVTSQIMAAITKLRDRDLQHDKQELSV